MAGERRELTARQAVVVATGSRAAVSSVDDLTEAEAREHGLDVEVVSTTTGGVAGAHTDGGLRALRWEILAARPRRATHRQYGVIYAVEDQVVDAALAKLVSLGSA